jgi:enoyl-CoA hydratase
MGEVRLSKEGSVGVITVSNPEVRNGLTIEMADQLVEACEEIDADQSLGATVIQGDSGTFCSGADTRTWGPMVDPASEEAYALTSKVYGAFIRFGHLAVPSIAAVRGAAVGAGMNLMLAADLRVVASNARLIAGFLRIGIHPGGGFFTLSGRLAGREGAAAMGLFNQEISGERAVEIGLAWESLVDDQVEVRALELAIAASKDPALVRAALSSFRTELGPPPVPWLAAVEIERGVQMWSQRRRAHNLKT